MSDHMKKRLNISGITKRNHELPWVCVNKVCGHMLILRLVYPSIGTLQSFHTQKSSQKLMLWPRHYADISLSIPTQ
jgi:hypothetical protein